MNIQHKYSYFNGFGKTKESVGKNFKKLAHNKNIYATRS